MPDETKSATQPAANPAKSPTIVEPTLAPQNPAAAAAPAVKPTASEILTEVARKIGESHNVLIALSSDPSVDEMAAAIGLSLHLDKLGKRATAIYSGATPNALEFLKPEQTFENSVDTLQDFVIALNKEKADHLRYKLDGDFVKIFITPYKSKISEENLEFSYGDFNVDLVLALDVANGVDLDSALREHGRIMHDAVIINITTGNPGKLGEIEWSDKSSSSVSEMIARMLYTTATKANIAKEEATAFLTGIVAATNRFANAKTTSETMKLASRLIDSGANQQLVSKNITPDVDNEMGDMDEPKAKSSILDKVEKKSSADDPTKLDIAHGNEEGEVDESKVVNDVITEKESTLLADLKAAEASLAGTGAETVAEKKAEPLSIDSSEAEDLSSEAPAPMPEVAPAETSAEVPVETPAPASASEAPAEPTLPPVSISAPTSEPVSTPAEEGFISSAPEKVLQPSEDHGDLSDFANDDEGANKYGQMLEDALESVNTPPVVQMPAIPAAPTDGAPMSAAPTLPEAPVMSGAPANPAASFAPSVPAAPEINGVPEINYMPMPGDAVLPPPPTPPIDANLPLPEAPALQAIPAAPTSPEAPIMPPVVPTVPAAPTPEPSQTFLGPQPAMQDQIYAPQVADPSAFKIPGA